MKTKERGKKIGEWERKNNRRISLILFFIGTIWLINSLFIFDSSNLPSNKHWSYDWPENIGYLLPFFGLPFFCYLIIISNFIKYSIYETEHDQYKTSKNSNLSIEKLECNNSNDIERQYNTYIRRFRRRIYTKKMFSNKIDILNKEIEKLKRLNKIPKDYPLIDILDEINCF